MTQNTPTFISANVDTNVAYHKWFVEIKQRFQHSQIKAAVRVNTAMLEFYWSLGQDIVCRQIEQTYGSGIVEQLSLDLKDAFPDTKGFSTTNIWYAKKWYLFYSQHLTILHQVGGELGKQKLQQPVGEIAETMPQCLGMVPWRHHIEIITHCKDVDEAIFYLQQTVHNNWSRRRLEDEIDAHLYAHHGNALTNFSDSLPSPQSQLANEILKDPYHLDFLSLEKGYSERQLEDALIHNITRFLLELGTGFAFIGRQMELRMPNGQSFFPDMIFYHTRLKCYVVVELKVVDFAPEFAGKLNFYVSAADHLLKAEDDNPSIGLLLCRSKDETIVKWSFQDINKPIGVASYQLQEVFNRTLTNNQNLKELQTKKNIIMNMKLRNIPFSPPDMTDAEVQEVANAILSGWITTGPRTKEFERQIAQYIGVPKAVCLNSQTACGEMALRLLGIGEGDEVIVPAYTYTASASIVCHVGAKLVFVDSQPNSLEMDYDALEAAITERTKVVIPVDLGGIPCDYDRIFQIVEKKKALFHPANDIQAAIGRIAVCADGAHAFGAIWKGQKIGSVADFTAFSFHAVKNLTTAEGGALTWRPIGGIDNEELYHQAQLYSLHGQSKDALAKTKLGAWEYDIVGPWYKCNMTDIMAAIGLVQLKRYPTLLARRKEIIERYNAAFQPLGIEVLDHYNTMHQSSGHLYITRIPGADLEKRQEIIVRMAERGIATNVHYKPLPMMTAYKDLGFDIANYPNAYAHFVNEITLPLHTCLTDEDVAYIIDNYTEIVSGKC